MFNIIKRKVFIMDKNTENMNKQEQILQAHKKMCDFVKKQTGLKHIDIEDQVPWEVRAARCKKEK